MHKELELKLIEEKLDKTNAFTALPHKLSKKNNP
jgi:hypothetical protein